MKHLEGKKVFLVPTGNNIKKSIKREILSCIVRKVARVNVTVEWPRGYQEKYKFSIYGKQISLDGGFNSGYMVFETKKEIEDMYAVREYSEAIQEKFQYQSHWQKLDIDTISKVAELLGISLPGRDEDGR